MTDVIIGQIPDPSKALQVVTEGSMQYGIVYVQWVVIAVLGYVVYKLSDMLGKTKDKQLEEEKAHSAKVEQLAQKGAATMDKILDAIEGKRS